jgi:UPF0755 protein
MKKNIKRIIILVLLISTLLLSLNFYNNLNVISHPFVSGSSNVKVSVKNGESLYSIINKLGKEGTVHSAILMKLYIKSKNLNIIIKPGTYFLKRNISLQELIEYLNNGIYDSDSIMVTIPEGYDIEHIASTLEEKGIISKEEFLKCCKVYKLPDYIKRDKKRKYELEGYLFPDTYALLKGMKGNTIIEIMLRRFDSVMNKIKNDKNIKSNEIDNIIIMASIVEKEIKKPDERSKAASVFYNRLSKKMKLESCATVEYALGYHKDKLLYSDLKVKSPYNTYLVNALPEGPICCPGKDAIIAAIEPAHTNYLYFVSNNDGTHTFTNSYAKFLEVKKVTQGFK